MEIRKKIVDKITLRQNDRYISVRSKVDRALEVLENNEPIPTGWVKAIKD